MSYQVLARKWRPQTFSELVGQQHVVDAITNALENNKLHHAYLFTGTRGVGKTTIARIFSKSLNCEKGQSANPCGVCDTCVDISDGRYVDLLEIDAASRTKVEDTRELLDNVQYRPTRGKYKVYLIDEVHMLSKHSFNALLKTLEEPPEHVKFLLATTDPQKLPVTILSRCLQFNLKALSQEQIQQHLSYILQQEQVPFEPSAIAQLAKAAQGSIRDSLSLTDQAIAQGNNQVSASVVANMLGLLNKNQILKLVKFICERDAAAAIGQLDDICSQSPDYFQVLSQLLALLHQIALTQVVPEVCKLEGESAKGIYTLANTLAKEHIQVLYQIGINGKRDLPHAPDARSGLQMTVLRMLAFSPVQKIAFDDSVFANNENNELDSARNLPAFDAIPEPQLERTTSNIEPTATPIIGETEPSGGSPVEPQEDAKLLAEKQQDKIENLANQQSNKPVDEQIKNNAEQELGDITETHADINQENAIPFPTEADSEMPPYESDMFGDPIQSYDLLSPQVEDDLQAVEPQAAAEIDEIEKTRQLLEVSRQLEEYTSEKEGEGSGKKPEIEEQSIVKAVEPSVFTLGYKFEAYQGDYPAFLANGDKLLKASQIDAWSAFIDSTSLKALSRQLLLHANCTELTATLCITIDKQYENLCEEEIVQNVEEILSAQFEQTITLSIQFSQTQNTPFQIQTRINEMRMQYAREVVETDSNIQELMKAFDATLIEGSVEVR